VPAVDLGFHELRSPVLDERPHGVDRSFADGQLSFAGGSEHRDARVEEPGQALHDR
jgi:hypothetical protein